MTDFRDFLIDTVPILFPEPAILFNNIHFPITNIGLYMLISTYIILSIVLLANNMKKMVYNKWDFSKEDRVDNVYSIILNQINKTKGQMFFPFIYSLFIFILINNLIGMIPYGFASTSHFFSIFSLSFIIAIGCTILGFFIYNIKFFSLLVPSGCPLGLLPLLVLIELISYLSRNVSLGLRLSANILSGRMLLNILSGFCYNVEVLGFTCNLCKRNKIAFKLQSSKNSPLEGKSGISVIVGAATLSNMSSVNNLKRDKNTNISDPQKDLITKEKLNIDTKKESNDIIEVSQKESNINFKETSTSLDAGEPEIAKVSTARLYIVKDPDPIIRDPAPLRKTLNTDIYSENPHKSESFQDIIENIDLNFNINNVMHNYNYTYTFHIDSGTSSIIIAVLMFLVQCHFLGIPPIMALLLEIKRNILNFLYNKINDLKSGIEHHNREIKNKISVMKKAQLHKNLKKIITRFWFNYKLKQLFIKYNNTINESLIKAKNTNKYLIRSNFENYNISHIDYTSTIINNIDHNLIVYPFILDDDIPSSHIGFEYYNGFWIRIFPLGSLGTSYYPSTIALRHNVTDLRPINLSLFGEGGFNNDSRLGVIMFYIHRIVNTMLHLNFNSLESRTTTPHVTQTSVLFFNLLMLLNTFERCMRDGSTTIERFLTFRSNFVNPRNTLWDLWFPYIIGDNWYSIGCRLQILLLWIVWNPNSRIQERYNMNPTYIIPEVLPEDFMDHIWDILRPIYEYLQNYQVDSMRINISQDHLVNLNLPLEDGLEQEGITVFDLVYFVDLIDTGQLHQIMNGSI